MSEETVETENEGGEQTETKGWLTSVPEKFRGHEVFKDIEKPEGVYERLINLTEKSKGMVKIPDDKAAPEDVQAYMKAMDIPESIEGYGIQKPENLPKGMVHDDVLSDTILKAFHEAKTPKAIVQKVFKTFNDYFIDFYTKFNEYVKEGNEKRTQILKNIWKGEYEAKNKQTFLAASKLAEAAKIPKGLYRDLEGVAAYQAWLKDNGLDTDPMHNYIWNRVFELVGDDTFVKGTASTSGTGNFLDEMFPSMKK